MWNGIQLHRTPFARTVYTDSSCMFDNRRGLVAEQHTLNATPFSCRNAQRIRILDRAPRLIWISCIHCIRVPANFVRFNSNARKTGRDIAGKNSNVLCVRVPLASQSLHRLWRTNIFGFSSVSIRSCWLAGWRLLATQFNLRLLFYISIWCNILVYAFVWPGVGVGDWWERRVFYLCIPFHSSMNSMCTVLVRFVRSTICLLVWLIK